MKKTLLAAALVIGYAGIAQAADTSVTLYGLIDTGIGYQQVKGNDANGHSFKESKTGLTTGIESGSRWGVKGTEDLGQGLQAIFQLESGFDSRTGVQSQSSASSDRLFGRQATIGLQGKSWGRLDFGRQFDISTKYLNPIDPFSGAFGQARMGAVFSSTSKMRWDNMVMYQTPNFSGFQFGAGYSFNVDGGQAFKVSGVDDRNSRGITTGLRYANGPINVALSWNQIKTGTPGVSGGTGVALGDADTNISTWVLGGTYDFAVAKIALAFGQTRNGWMQGLTYGGTVAAVPGSSIATATNLPTFYGAQGLRVNSYLVGLTAPVGSGAILASWTMADPRDSADNPANFFGGDLAKQNTYNLGYTYGMSKRTDLYAVASYAKNASFQRDLKSTFVSVGIRHRF
jgi:predicted porin